jgi:hypothetical protein
LQTFLHDLGFEGLGVSKNVVCPLFPRAEAAKLDQQCNPLTPRPAMSPEELKALKDSLNAAMMRSKQAN